MKKWSVAVLLSFMLLASAWAAAPLPVVDVYKSPQCGCCGDWVAHMRANGFTVRVHDTEDVARHKYRLGVPTGYGSCHTAEVDGYLVEGHVPAEQVKRLLAEHPKARGLVVPGMPAGSPGMDTDGRKQPYSVLRVESDGRLSEYARY